MDAELKKALSLIKNKGVLVGGLPTSETFSNTTDSLENLKDTLGNAVGASLSADIAAVQSDLGNPSARTNLQTIEAMLGNADIAASSLWNLILDLKRDETIVKLTDAWNDEDGINLNVWATAVTGTATAARNTAEGGKLKVRLDTVAGAQTARLRSYDRFAYAPSTMTGAHIIRKTVLEFEGKFTNLANVDEANVIFGFTPAIADTRATADIAGFYFSGAPAAGTLSSLTDNGGVETTNVVGTGLTLTNWNKYMIEVYDNSGTATIKFTVTDGSTTNTATHTTNIPTQNGFIQFYNVDDNAGGTFAIFDVGMTRLYSYDTNRY